MTFSIAARCDATGQVGVAIASSSPAVAARCVYARAGVGAATSQNVTDPRLGPALLDAMAAGLSAPAALDQVAAGASHIEYRQLLAVDARGQGAARTGAWALGTQGQALGPGAVAGGNLLAASGVPQAMVDGFAESQGALGDRLLASLDAGLKAGGEAGPVHSAGLLIADRMPWPAVDLRVDWTEDCPIAALAQVWAIYKPQVD
ncbi:MAG: DUF1028 domain-containing protein, partial [Pseudomonadota bacterium]